jgi:SAM-dependent methyltransferase
MHTSGPTSPSDHIAGFDEWLRALENRHLSNLRVQEVTRALRALSASYVQKRGEALGRSLDSAGKRAAFALFYAPLHLLTTHRVVRALAADPPPQSILDIGCGTGVAGAAWALAAGGQPPVTGIDRHPWAAEEANWTYRQLRVTGRARPGDIARLPPVTTGTAIVAAYVLNELPVLTRRRVEDCLVEAAGRGAQILIIEPISRSVAPWWDATADRFAAAGGRTDVWRFPVELPAPLRMFDKAAGLDHRELTARSLYCAGAR